MNLEEHDNQHGHGIFIKNELSKYRKIVNSQCGEDGILEEIFKRIKSNNRQCVEFGAHNGIFLSNTKKLINDGWLGVMIESDKTLFGQLQKNMAREAICIHKFVEDLDKVLSKTPIEKDFDLVSMDVDNGAEYDIWKRTVVYSPKVVLIEFDRHSNSLDGLKKLGKEKGYKLVATTCWNAFFIRNDCMEHFKEI